MALTLAQYKVRVLALLMDSGAAIWTVASDVSAECLRLALHEYSDATPCARETYIVAPAAGRELALSGISGLRGVTDVWFPFDPDVEDWPPSHVPYRVWWDDGSPVLFLSAASGVQPQTDDEIRVFYTVDHTIQDLDSAAATTIPATHESIIVVLAAGNACFARAVDVSETSGVSSVTTPNLGALGSRWLKEGRRRLEALRAARPAAGVSGESFGVGWGLDQWEGENG